MHALGEFAGASRTLNGDLIISFVIDEQDIPPMEGTQIIDIQTWFPSKSLAANNYFWKLCTEIAKVVKSDKETIYQLQLQKYGSYADLRVNRDALAALKRKFRYVEEMSDGFDEYTDSIDVRCYWGISHYDKKEMQVLIEGTVRDAADIGIHLITDEEVNALIKNWKGSN